MASIGGGRFFAHHSALDERHEAYLAESGDIFERAVGWRRHGWLRRHPALSARARLRSASQQGCDRADEWVILARASTAGVRQRRGSEFPHTSIAPP